MTEQIGFHFNGDYGSKHQVSRVLEAGGLVLDDIVAEFAEFLKQCGWVFGDLWIDNEEDEWEDDEPKTIDATPTRVAQDFRLGDFVRVFTITKPEDGIVHDRTGYVVGWNPERDGSEYEVSFPGWKGGHNGLPGASRAVGDHWFISGAALSAE